MRFSTFAAGLFSLVLVTGACGGSDDGGGTTPGTGGTKATGGSSGSTGGTSGGTGGTSGGTGGTSGGTGGSSAGTGGSGTPGATTYADVKPIFAAKCGPCHTTTGIVHKLGINADDAMKAVTNKTACGSATTVGACTIVRIKAGSMPAISPKCSGNPTTDAANDKCLTQAEQDKVQAWVDGGLK
jgi:hypothetical protein